MKRLIPKFAAALALLLLMAPPMTAAPDPAAASTGPEGATAIPEYAADNPDAPAGPKKPSRKERREQKKKDAAKKKESESKEPEKKETSFADAIKDHETIHGLFTIHKKDDEYLLEIKPDQFDKQFMTSLTRETGIGETFLLGVQVLWDNPIYFKKIGKDVQLLLKNPRFTAMTDPEMARAVKRSFSDSLVGTSSIRSEPHPDTKAVLVDLSPYFLTDPEGAALFFGQVFQTPVMVDARNSFISDLRGFDKNLEVGATMHFAAMLPLPLVDLADGRSFFVNYRYSISDIPAAEGFIPRLADDRVGHFITFFMDLSDDTKESPYVRYVTRWNLQKKDPTSDASEPVEPITYWLENSIPKKYRKALGDGTLLWNDAFERIGFKNAVVVKEQPDDAKWDPADVRYSTVRWFVTTTGGFAIGPSRINPHTGQIYDADIGWAEALVSGRLREYEEFSNPVTAINGMFEELSDPLRGRDPRLACNFARGAAMQMGFGLDLLAMRGIAPESEAGQAYINGFIKYVQAHEVGHTLGLRHNFRASTINQVRDLQDASTLSKAGLTASVMDYVPVNLAGVGKPQGPFWQDSLGPYDHWAIEYAYRQFPNQKTPEDILPELKQIASKVADPARPYGTDEDTTDPRTSVWDLGTSPLEFYQDRVDLVHEVWEGAPKTFAQEDDAYQRTRRAFGRGLGQYALASFNVSKTIGGLLTHRDHVGDPGARTPMVPVPAALQREALGFITKNLFAADAFDAPADLLNRLGANRWWDFEFSVFDLPRMEFPLHDAVLAIQANVLANLYGRVKLSSLQDLEMMYKPDEKPFTIAEMFDEVQAAVWSEVLTEPRPVVNSFRRGLQREHLRRLLDLLDDAAIGAPPDAAMMARANAQQLLKRIDTLLGGTGLDASTRAHLDETRARITTTLDAFMVRRAGR